jgi:hypothetical protein
MSREKVKKQLENETSGFNTPILFVVFNRLDTVKKTFDKIRFVKPKKLFVACDGPRNPEEKERTDAVREYIMKNIDWKCEIKTLFEDKNFGCKNGVMTAIDWFFKNVEQGIILEDDCVPSISFFQFTEEMLNMYKNNLRIFSVNGYNYLKKTKVKESYYFSKYFAVWGWATWKDRWFAQDKSMNDYLKDVKSGKFKKIFRNPIERIWVRRGFGDYLSGKVGAWDDSFSYLQFKNKGLCVKPKVNLIENIGFRKDSTHTSGHFIDKKFYCFKRKELSFPLKHPKKIEENKIESRRFFNKIILRIILKKGLFFYQKQK